MIDITWALFQKVVEHWFSLFTMNALKKMMAISLSLWLIMITPALVGGSRIHSCSKEAALVGGSGVYGRSKEAVVMARGPVPSSSSSPCTHIGIGNGNDRPCPPHPLIHGDNDG